MHERDILFAALEIDSLPEREAYIARICGEDAQLRSRVEALLRSAGDAGSFLERPLLQDQPTKGLNGTTDGDAQHEPAAEELSFDFLDPSDVPEHLGRLEQFEVLERIGQGGMGVVLKAHDTRLNRTVAIKVLAPHFAAHATARKRFLREARAAAAVNHPHVITIHAVDENHSLPYLVMEYVDGLSLREKIDREGTLELREILRIGSQIAAGLAAAHKHGMIHRDIKPANILLENGVERVKLTDFGLARAIDDLSITRTGEVAGTPQYMSPEQAQGNPVDQRSDLFSLGSVLYAMCTGRAAFRAESAMAIMHRICHDTPRAIRELNPDIPPWLVEIVDRLLAKDPDQRFHSAEEVAELLGQCLAHVQHPTLAADSPAAKTTKLEEIAGPELAARIQGEPKESSDHGPDTVVVQARTRRRPWTSFGSRWIAAAAALLVLIGLLTAAEGTGVTHFAGTVIRMVSGEGTLIIELDDPTIQVSIDGDQVRIHGGGVEELRLTPGKYKFTATKDGKPIKTQLVSITRGGKETVRVTLEGRPAKEKSIAPRPPPETNDSEQWVSLFNGKDLTGWKTHPDAPGSWTVEDGILVGRAPWTFLFSERGDYENFELRLEAKINKAGDSGVFIRSESGLDGTGWATPFPRAYEVQIAGASPGNNDQTGTLADAGRKTLILQERLLSEPDTWFTLDVIARGNHLTVKVNGEIGADYVDEREAHTKGHLTLQANRQGCVVQFRKIEIRELPPSEPASESIPAEEKTLADDVLAAYTFEPDTLYEQDGKSYVRDVTGHGYDGRYQTAAPLTEGLAGAALGMADEKEGLWTDPLISDLPEFTVAGWVKFDSTRPSGQIGGLYRLTAARIDAPTSVIAFGRTFCRVTFLTDSGWKEVGSPVDLRKEQWNFVAVTWVKQDEHSGSIRVTVNERSFSETLPPLRGTAQAAQIGPFSPAGVDEVAVYQRALSEAEIKRLYEGGLAGRKLPDILTSELVNRALELAERGEFDRAAQAWHRAIWLKPDKTRRPIENYWKLHDSPEVFQRVAALNPTLDWLWVDHATYWMHRSQWAKAGHAYTDAPPTVWREDRTYQELAPALLLAGEIDHYLRLQHGWRQASVLESDRPPTSRIRILIYLFGACPDSEVDPKRLVERGEELVRANAQWSELNALGLACYRAGEFEQAVTRLEESNRIDHGGQCRASNLWLLALAHRRLGNEQQASEYFNAAQEFMLAKAPQAAGEPARIASFNWGRANLYRREAQLEFDPDAFAPVTAYDYMLRAEAYLRRGELDKAVEDFIGVIEHAPDKAWDHESRLFETLLANDDIFQRMAQLRPEDDDLWIERGQYHLRRNEWASAVADYAHVVEGRDLPFPRWEPACLKYALALLLSGKENAYQSLCERLVKEFGENPNPRTGFVLAEIGTLHPASAVDPQRLVAWARAGVDTAHPRETLRVLGLALYRAGRFEEAVATLEESERQPGIRPVRHAFPLALAYHQLGKTEDSRRWFDAGLAAMESGPTNTQPWLNLFLQEAKSAITPDPSGARWVSLFNGRDLTGWRTHPENPDGWTIENGVLVGRGPQHYLFSQGNAYADFHLRVEAKVNAGGDGGVFFRCKYPQEGNAPQDGFEANIRGFDSIPNRETAFGPQDPLFAVTDRSTPPEQWFTMEVIARGNRVTVVVDGQTIAEGLVRDRYFDAGVIALQSFFEGSVIEFRKIEIKELPIQGPEWVSLFNGKDLAGWKAAPHRPGRWTVEEGAIVGRGPDNSLLYSERDDYENFHLRAEVRIIDRGNSGLLFRSSFGMVDEENVNVPSHNAQVEVIPGKTNGSYITDVYKSPTDSTRYVVLSDMLPDSGNWDDWFLLELIADGRRIVIKLDNQVVVETIDSRYPIASGHLALESYNENTVVQFRKIEIRELPRNADRLTTVERLLAAGEVERAAAVAVEGISQCGGEFGDISDWDGICEQIAVQRPELTDVWNARAEYYARRRRWQEAAADYRRAWELGGVQSVPLYAAACTLLLSDDRRAYARLCRAYVDWKGDNLDPVAAAELFSLGPNAEVDSRQVLDYAERTVARGPRMHEYGCGGAAFLRAGDNQRAIHYLTTAFDELGQGESVVAFRLALAYHRQGDVEQARKWFDRGLAIYRSSLPSDPDLPEPWALSHRLEFNVWYREATREIDPGVLHPDRTAAQWVLDLGGQVAVERSERSPVQFINPVDTLPKETFKLTWIKLLDADGVNDDDLQRLTGLRHLSILNLSGTDVNDQGAARLIDLPELTHLNLVDTKVTDEGLAPLAGNPRLTQLFLSRTAITDQAVPVLSKMKLRQLTLDGTKVTFDGLKQLAGHPTLESLNISQLGLTEDEVRALGKLLPNCRIDSDFGVTEPTPPQEETSK